MATEAQQPVPPEDSLLRVPAAVVQSNVLACITPHDIHRLGSTCKQLREATCSCEGLWQRLCTARDWRLDGAGSWRLAFSAHQARCCVECGTQTKYVFQLLGCRLCEGCEPTSPRYSLVTTSEALEHYGLDPAEVSQLPTFTHHGVRLYLRTAVVAIRDRKRQHQQSQQSAGAVRPLSGRRPSRTHASPAGAGAPLTSAPARRSRGSGGDELFEFEDDDEGEESDADEERAVGGSSEDDDNDAGSACSDDDGAGSDAGSVGDDGSDCGGDDDEEGGRSPSSASGNRRQSAEQAAARRAAEKAARKANKKAAKAEQRMKREMRSLGHSGGGSPPGPGTAALLTPDTGRPPRYGGRSGSNGGAAGGSSPPHGGGTYGAQAAAAAAASGGSGRKSQQQRDGKKSRYKSEAAAGGRARRGKAILRSPIGSLGGAAGRGGSSAMLPFEGMLGASPKAKSGWLKEREQLMAEYGEFGLSGLVLATD